MSRTHARVTQADVARVADKPGVVYFVDLGKKVKIGFSTNLPARLKAFETSNTTVDLILSIPGGRKLEKELHELLSEARMAREMFHFDWRLIRFVEFCNGENLEGGLEFLRTSTPARRERAKREAREKRILEARKTKAEKDAYFASLVADRVRRLGW